jgi:hypothetical protein
MENQNNKPKGKFNFKQYIDNNPEYKAKHMAYVCTKLECDCGRFIARANMANHKRTKVHTEILKLKNTIKKEDT